MPGCSVHSYLISPALPGVNENFPPLPNWSEAKSAPESALTSWSTESSLTQVTFWPTLTVWDLGANWMFFIATVTAPPEGAGVALELVPESEESDPQPAAATHRRGIMKRFIALHLDA